MNLQKKFWKWVSNELSDPEEKDKSRTLFLNGTIAEESWFDDDVTPALFRSELEDSTGDITVWINSPGGDCFAAAQIYNMLCDYTGKVTVKIDGLAASAASVIAMAGDDILVSPVSMMMIHNPSTIAMGDTDEMQKAIRMLDSVKDAIINAYQAKTGLSRNKLGKLMDEETWMDAEKAVELHFADHLAKRDTLYGNTSQPGENQTSGMLFSRRQVAAAVNKKLCDYASAHQTENKYPLYRVDELEARLGLIKSFI
jgi:ATP-dependent Clp protease protease subunit